MSWITGRHVGALLFVPVVAVLLVSCGDPDPGPTADKLATGLTRLDLAEVPLDSASARVAPTQLAAATKEMGGLRPRVTVGRVGKDAKTAAARLEVRWTLKPGVEWTYSSVARLRLVGDAWKVHWTPAVLAPGLTADGRLVLCTTQPTRGVITGAGQVPIVTARPVVHVGIDKSAVDASKAKTSAGAVARIVGVDPARFVAAVAAAGPKAFVEAIVLRAGDVPAARLRAVPGALLVDGTLPLAPSRGFAAPILGSVGDATAELVDKSDGRLSAGDQTGLSGLQLRYDAQLRGVDGVTVRAVSTTAPDGAGTTLFTKAATVGKPLSTTLDPMLQTVAERALSTIKPASAVVAIRPSTGDVLAAASGPGGGGLSTATVGQYAPGSTFKVVSSLAMLRNGYTPSTTVTCSPTITVNGKTFKNYDDYPKDEIGRIPLRTAIANSCNTAVISANPEVPQTALASAAASLGLGVDHDLGFAVFLGSVPAQAELTEHAASMIGQGKVAASPLAMATVAASVESGHTVVPRLLPAQAVPPVRTTLTGGEAGVLRGLMRAVVTEGSGRALRSIPGKPVGAKTGTAEYGSDTPPRTHAWMIAIQGDLAVAVFVADGSSGSGTAGPILEQFLRAADR